MSSQIGPVILDIEGLTLTPEEEEIVLHPQVGGVIFFSRNYESPEQIWQLSSRLKALRSDLVLCVDQEGGRVQRFKKGCTLLPKLKVLGELFDANVYPLAKVQEISEKLGYLMALEVRSLGVDLSFAPVLDLDLGLSEVMKDRCIHQDPKIVSLLAISYIKGMGKAGMRATGKHFPGHGAVTLDSHFALPQDPRSMLQIQKDMLPFKTLIEFGISAIMPAHIVFPQIDPFPVGFSAYWLQAILRQKLGFKHTIISDDLSMEGAKGIGSYGQRTNQALEAGCDFVLICNNRQGAIEALQSVNHKHPLSQKRRSNLLAQGEPLPWQTLTKTAQWQEAHDILRTLEPFWPEPALAVEFKNT
ncbi:MAG: beta-N-acetylhexosaminidase [Proteobacteria bacterium]|nr:beta-N-acetylhexosaminidase [Pseudomonadota bacterium]